jgi:hypothetical protein
MPPVAAMTPSLNFSEALIIPVVYAASRAKNVPKVSMTACPTIPP